MAVKSFKPYTAGRRQMTMSSFDEITASKPEKSLTEIVRRSGGRNNQVDLRFAIKVVVTSDCIVLSILSGLKMVFLQQLRRLNMILIGLRELLCFFMLMEKNVTFWLQRV